MAGRWRSLDLLYELAEEHAGYFTSQQARSSGVAHTMLSYHTARGDLERMAHGVYRLTRYPVHPFGDVIAAVLWAGSDAAASHETALAVYGLAEVMPSVIHLTLPRRFRGERAGVRVHQAPLPALDVWPWEQVRVTRPERTLLDAARTMDPTLVREAAREALAAGLITRRRLARAVAEAPDAARIRETLRVWLPKVTDSTSQVA